MALVIFLLVTVIAFVKHGMHFFSFFLPAGVPIFLAPLMIAIEVISYFTRPFSLSIRPNAQTERAREVGNHLNCDH